MSIGSSCVDCFAADCCGRRNWKWIGAEEGAGAGGWLAFRQPGRTAVDIRQARLLTRGDACQGADRPRAGSSRGASGHGSYRQERGRLARRTTPGEAPRSKTQAPKKSQVPKFKVGFGTGGEAQSSKFKIRDQAQRDQTKPPPSLAWQVMDSGTQTIRVWPAGTLDNSPWIDPWVARRLGRESRQGRQTRFARLGFFRPCGAGEIVLPLTHR